MINRFVTRTILGGTETTASTNSPSENVLSFSLIASDYFYIGFDGKFTTRYFSMGAVNANAATVSVEYWNGASWASVGDLIDGTNGFTQSGFISWANFGDWKKTSVTPLMGRELYWVRVSVSADLSALTTLQACLNLFSSDEMLRVYYPWLVSDSRFLPEGRTNFLEQHVAAKDLCVKHLRDRRVIETEAQVINPEAIAPAAVHAAAYLILLPVSTSDQFRQLRDDAMAMFVSEIGQTILSTDQDADGIVDEHERGSVESSFVMRR